MFCACRSDLHAFAMEPLLTYVAANPELISTIAITASPAHGFSMFIIFMLFQSFLLIFWQQCRLWLSALSFRGPLFNQSTIR
ncbi:PHD finger protein [Trifolium repens]|nr:PHD finger protein [Trifolium repens]